MNWHAVNAYLSEIRWQSQIAVRSFEGLKNEISLRRRKMQELADFAADKPSGRDRLAPGDLQRMEGLYEDISTSMVRTLMHLQGILASTGIISEVFWPNTTRGAGVELRARQRRAEEMRRRTRAQDDSALRYRPGGADDARGGLLHIDEMIDRALALTGSRRVERFYLGSFDVCRRGVTGTPRMPSVRWMTRP